MLDDNYFYPIFGYLKFAYSDEIDHHENYYVDDYCYGICSGHVFHDGNNQTAYVVAITFLSLNGIECISDQADIVLTIVSLASGNLSENELAEWFRKNEDR